MEKLYLGALKNTRVLKSVYLKLLVGVMLCGGGNVMGQISYATMGSNLTQNFNGLSATAPATWTNNVSPLPGWYSTTTTLNPNTGTTNSNNVYNFGSASAADRALGAISTATTHNFGIRIKNNTGVAIASLTVSFTGEQWRLNSASQTLVFEYQIGTTVTSITGGSWTGVTSLDFISPNLGTAAAVDGNLPGNRTAKSATFLVSVPSGSEIMLRWTKAGSNSHGLAIDDLSVIASATATTDLYWNGGNITPQSANWNTGLWYPTTSATTGGVAWPSSGTNTANFQNANGGVVTLPASYNSTPDDVSVSSGNNAFTFSTAAATASDLTSKMSLTTSSVLNVAPNATGPVTFSGIISGAGALNFNGTGTGTKTLSAANTYTGGTTLSDGTLVLANAAALGATTSTFNINGGAIDAASALTITNNNPQSWGGNFSFTGSNNLNLGTGNVSLTGNRTLTTTANTLTVGGGISGGFSLTKNGAGTLTLPGVASFSGGLIMNAGTLNLSGNNTYTGGTALNGGTLRLGSATALGAGSSTLTITGGTIDATSALTLTNNNAQNWNGSFSFTGSNALNTGTGGVSVSAGAKTVNIVNNVLTVGGAVTGSGSIVKTGTGTLRFNAAGSFSGGSTLSGGTLLLGATSALGTGPLILNGGTLRTGPVAGAGFSQLTGTLELTQSSTIELGTGNHTLGFSDPGGFAAGQTLTIVGWVGTPGSSGLEGKVVIGGTPLTATELNQINFSGYPDNTGAQQLPGGEIVPRLVTLDFVNLQFPGSATITVGGTLTAYAQVYKAGLTEAGGQAAGITAWIGYSSTDNNPNSGGWTWIPATFNVQAGNNDEYTATFGAALPAGTYYYASRFLITGGVYQYGGYNGGAWNGTTNINGVLTINDNTVDFCNLQTPYAGSILRGGGFNVYAQVYEPGVTEAAGAGAGIAAWIGYNTASTNPNSAGWTWVPAGFNVQVGNNDEFVADLGAALSAVGSGSYYYASRFQIGSGSYSYGGITPGGMGGNFWDGTNYISGLLNIADVKGNAVLIPYGGTSTSTGNNTDFGTTCPSAPVTKTFTIANNSTTHTLNFGSISITGAAAADYTVTTAPTLPVAASGSTSFVISFTPGAAGARNATINVATDAASYSFAVTGTGQAATAVTTQPSNQSVASLSPATFTAAGTGQGTVTFQWQILIGATWTNLTNGSPYSGVTTATLTIDPAAFSLNGNQYRCVLTATCGSVNTNAATLTVTAGAIWTNPITGGGILPSPYTTGDLNDPNIMVSGIGRGTGIVGNAATGRYNATGWDSPALDENDYFDFTLTANAGYEINFTNFVYSGQASGSGPVSFAFRSSLDGFSTNIGTATATGSTINLSSADYQNIGCSITFRIYGWGASASGGSFSVNDFTFNGTVTTPVTGKLTINNGGTPPAGTINLGVNDQVITGFNLLANASQTVSAISFTKTGTATAADISNLRIFWDQNSNGIIDGADASVSGAGIPLATTMNFTAITGQTFGCPGRHYLLVADVSASATPGRTITASIASSADVTSTLSNKTGTAAGNLQTIIFTSLASDYYRSNVVSGNWNAPSSWLSSRDNSNFYAASSVPTSAAGTITIMSPHTIIVNSSVSLDELTVNGILELQTGSVLNINDGTGDDITIATGGKMNVKNGNSNNYAGMILQNANASVNIAAGGKIAVLGNGANVASNMQQFATETRNTWNHHAVFEWNCSTGTMGWSGETFFPNAGSSTIPYLVITATLSGPGGGTATTINGLTIFNTPVTVAGGSAKNFRNGIAGSSVLTQNTTSGNSFNIGGSNAILGGSGLQIVLNTPLNFTSNVTVPSDSAVKISGSSVNNTLANTLTVNGTLDITNVNLTNTNGTVIINGTYRTATSPGSSTAELCAISAGSSVTLNPNSTVELYANADQLLKARSDFSNLTFSGSGTKTITSGFNPNGNVTINNAAILDVAGFTFGQTTTVPASVTNLVMNGGRFRVSGTNSKPDIDGVYTLAGGVVEFANSGTAGNETIKGISAGSNPIVYNQIEVTGNRVAQGGANITLGPNGIFTVKSNGIFENNSNAIVGPDPAPNGQSFVIENNGLFKSGNVLGFYGPSVGLNSPGVRDNIETVNLMPGSTVEYARETGVLPSSAADGNQVITIPFSGGVPVAYQNLTLSGDGNKTAPAAELMVNGNLTGAGSATFLHNAGTVSLGSTTAAQTYTATLPFIFNDLNINNTSLSGITVNSNMSVLKKLGFATGSKSLNLNNGDIILKSSDTLTSNVGEVPAGLSILYGTNSRFNIERYLPSYRAWRFVAAPVVKGAGQSPSVREAWQEGGATTAGYGTYITGPSLAGTGFDTLSTGYSLKWFDASINNYREVGNTNDSLVANDAGYMVYVRGDRTISPTGPTRPTNLRIRGKIRTGDQTFTLPGGPSGVFQSIGNPYASAFSVADLINNYSSAELAQSYTAWDPTLNGSYGAGGFQTLSETDGYKASAAGSGLYLADSLYPNIESGQAFYLFNPSTTPVNVVITESMKQDGSRLASRENTPADRQFLRTRLYTNTGAIADGNLVAIDDEYDNGADAWDALKFTNGGENFGLSRYGKKLSVEARGRLHANDTIFYNMSNLREQAYQLQLAPENLASTGLEGYFTDRFLNTQTPVSLAGPTTLSFTVTSNAASKAANRFLLVFKAMAGPLPVTFVSVSAQRQSDRSIMVNWKVANELNIIKYEVERSADGTQFSSILTRDAAGMSAYSKTDLSPLAADNFYRIKAIGIGGEISYSSVVKVSPINTAPSISIYPNPVRNGLMSVQFGQQEKGIYTLRLTDAKGSMLYKGTVQVAGTIHNESIALGETIAAGTYQLTIESPGRKVQTLQVLVR